MTLTNFPNGISSFGVPILGGAGGTGLVAFKKVYFVDKQYGNDGNSGLSVDDHSFRTIQKALDVVRDSDSIIVLPSTTYDEQLTTGMAAGHPTAVPNAPAGQGRYVTLMGASNTKWAYDSPSIYNASGDTACLVVNSPGFRVSGFRFIGDSGSPICIYAPIGQAAATAGTSFSAGVQIDNNFFNGSVDNCTGITMQAVMYFHIFDNLFDYFPTATSPAIANASGGFSTYPRGYIQGNVFSNCAGCIVAPYASTLISNNMLMDSHVNPITKGIVLTGGNSNTVTLNHLGGAAYGSTMYVGATGDNWIGNLTSDKTATNILDEVPWTSGSPAT